MRLGNRDKASAAFCHSRVPLPLSFLLIPVVSLFSLAALPAAGVKEARQEFISGNYSNAIAQSKKAVEENEYGEDWPLLLAESLMAVGRYPEARAVIEAGLERYPRSVRLRVSGRDVFLHNDAWARAREMLEEINQLASTRMWAYQDPQNLVALGRAALWMGVDPRGVLDHFFDRVKKAYPEQREAYLASGDLALDKNDFDLAAKVFQEGLKRFPDDAEFHYGLARAFAPSDRRQMLAFIDGALRSNTNYTPAYVLLADHLVDGEEYKAAREVLDKAHSVNPWLPEAWAYRAVIAHLEREMEAERESREKALKFWSTNPEVDYIIGRKLSQKYRFAEGAEHQRQALRFDPAYLPAKIQLAQDLLRLGQEEEGWRLAEEVYEDDAYDVMAYNLVTLEEQIEKFQTLTNEHFVLRMSERESAVYGERALDLLERARQVLCAKYEMEIETPVIVEIFPEQKDFGVRTFGMPDNPGFLGVCFGSVITANSPASQGGNPSNWEAVLWHEFCHVITLQLTRNKMPRWLSEGISVYEERQANLVWGQHMTPQYREMVLGEDLTPVGNLSAAFLAPKSNLHLQFAYYESSLVVEFLVERFGLDKLRLILRDLRNGVEINQAIAAHTAPLEEIEEEFAEYARARAKQLAPELDFEKPERRTPNIAEWFSAQPKNYYALLAQAQTLLSEEKYEEAKEPLQTLIEYFPNQFGPESAYNLLAFAHRKLDETGLEKKALEEVASRDADAISAFLRLMELDAALEQWPAVWTNAQRFVAVNPLVPQPYRYLGRAGEELGESREAARAYRVLLLLDPPDPADAHFRLARLLRDENDPEAKRHVLQALEEAPRFRDAHRLLLEMNRGKNEPAPPEPEQPERPPAVEKP